MLKLNLQYFGHLMQKSQFIGKDPNPGKDRGQEEKRVTEDEMVGWHHWINGLEFEQTPEDNERQGSLACCSPRGRKQVDVTEWLKNNSNDSSTRQRANLSHSTGRLLGFKGAVFSALGICEYEMNLFFSFPILRMRTIPGKHRQWCSGDGWPRVSPVLDKSPFLWGPISPLWDAWSGPAHGSAPF